MPLPLILPDTAATVVIAEATADSVLTQKTLWEAISEPENNGLGGKARAAAASDEQQASQDFAIQASLPPRSAPISLLTHWDDNDQPSRRGSALAGDGSGIGRPAGATPAQLAQIDPIDPTLGDPPVFADPPSLDPAAPPPGAADPDLPANSNEPANTVEPEATPDPAVGPPGAETTTGTPSALPSGAPLILQADTQNYDPERQIISATGNVLVQFGNAQLAADRLWVNLQTQYLRAEGNVFFNRNEQIIRGDDLVYNLAQGSGEITNATGELLLTQIQEDFSPTPGIGTDGDIRNLPIDYRLRAEGSISQVTSPGGVTIATDTRQPVFGGEGNDVRKLRFESALVTFDDQGWYIEELRLTNDPFSPPELEFRGQNVSLTPINEEQDELLIESPRFVFDQGLTIPVLQSRYILNRGQLSTDELNPLPTGIGYDDRDRDGLFIERAFSVNLGNPWSLTVVPQFYVSRWLNESSGDLIDPANFGLVTRLSGALGPRTSASATISLSGLDLDNLADRLRGSFRTQQLIGDHTLNLEYSYRDRLFNGTLGFQDVQSSLGLLLASPVFVLGDTQLTLQYQTSAQYVTANTDRPELIDDPNLAFDLTTLFRFQGAATLGRWFPLWSGTALPATPTEGLRYSPRPLVPYLAIGAGLRGVGTYYTSSDVQASLEAYASLYGQFGHLSQDFFDFTQFNLGFSTKLVSDDLSPFLFDRDVDNNVLSGGILQQIYGPFLAGFQTSINVDTGEAVNTDVVLEYRRRSYGLVVRFNPVQRTGFFGFRLSDFDWQGQTAPFDANQVEAEPPAPAP